MMSTFGNVGIHSPTSDLKINSSASLDCGMLKVTVHERRNTLELCVPSGQHEWPPFNGINFMLLLEDTDVQHTFNPPTWNQ